MRRLISIGVGLFLFTLSACDKESPAQTIKETQASPAQTIKAIQGNNNVSVQSGGDTHLTITQQYRGVITKSDEYQQLVKRRDEAVLYFDALKESAVELRAKKQQEIVEIETQIKTFVQDVQKLAADFNKIPLNTKRLKEAKQAFDQGEFAQARNILDSKLLAKDQKRLKERQQNLVKKRAEEDKVIEEGLKNNADEYVIKAQLIALNYAQENRIETAAQHFELALESSRQPDILFAYAYFLQKNNQRTKSEKYYQEALKAYRQLAKQNPHVYRSDVADTLNNLGILVEADTRRHAEAETLFQEALKIYRQLATQNPHVYRPYVAQTLNNLGVLVKADTQRWAEAEMLYQEALTLRRQLAKQNPHIYLPDVATSLNNLGILVSDNTHRRTEAETLYQEALKTFRQLAKKNPHVYLYDLATTLNNLGTLVRIDIQRYSEAKTLYQEALKAFRQLTKKNPHIYLPDVAMTLNNLGALASDNTQRRVEAEKILPRSFEKLIDSWQKKNPYVYLPNIALMLSNLGLLVQVDTQRRVEAEKFYQEALKAYRQLAKKSPASI